MLEGCSAETGFGIVALVSACYLFNPDFGVFELLPDNLPVVGNLDEVFFAWA